MKILATKKVAEYLPELVRLVRTASCWILDFACHANLH